MVRQVQAREVNVDSFRTLQSVTRAARECLQSTDPQCAEFSGEVLEAVKLECQMYFEVQQLQEACR